MLLSHKFNQYLEQNNDPELYRGQGVWIKDDTPPEIVEELRAIHERAVSGGLPYMFLDFLAEDIKKGLVEQRFPGSDAYRKGTRPPKLDLAARRERRRRDEEK